MRSWTPPVNTQGMKGFIWPVVSLLISSTSWFSCHFAVSQVESLKHKREELQNLLQKQKFTPADVERINREKRELQQTISTLSKSLEDAEQHKWNTEITLAKVKEKVLCVHVAHKQRGWHQPIYCLKSHSVFVYLILCLYTEWKLNLVI